MNAIGTMRHCAVALVLALALALPGVAGAATVKTEAEAIPHAGRCWTPLPWTALSGGQGRYCAWTDNAPLSWSVDVPAGKTGVVKLYGHRDPVRRAFRVRIDGGAWRVGYSQGASAASVLLHTTPTLQPGSHRVDLEWVASDGSFTFDYAELETGGGADDPGTCAIAPADGQDAIAAAIRSCPNGSTVRFPAGKTYVQTGPIVVDGRSDLTIDGNGSTFRSTAPNDGQRREQWRLHKGRRLILKDMTIVGNFVGDGGPRRINLGNQFNAGVLVSGGHTITLRDLTVKDVWGDHVLTAPSGWVDSGNVLAGEVPTDVHVERLTGTRAARQGVAVTAAEGFWLEDSTITDSWYTGIDLEIDVPGEPLHDVHILGNTLSGFYISAIGIPNYGRPGDVRDIEIRGNKTATASDTCWPAISTKSVGTTAQNIVIEDNNLKSLYHGIAFTDVLSGSIRNNEVELVASPKNLCGHSAKPIVGQTFPSVSVAGNTPRGY